MFDSSDYAHIWTRTEIVESSKMAKMSVLKLLRIHSHTMNSARSLQATCVVQLCELLVCTIPRCAHLVGQLRLELCEFREADLFRIIICLYDFFHLHQYFQFFRGLCACSFTSLPVTGTRGL